jgi:hypothetical protein
MSWLRTAGYYASVLDAALVIYLLFLLKRLNKLIKEVRWARNVLLGLMDAWRKELDRLADK